MSLSQPNSNDSIAQFAWNEKKNEIFANANRKKSLPQPNHWQWKSINFVLFAARLFVEWFKCFLVLETLYHWQLIAVQMRFKQNKWHDDTHRLASHSLTVKRTQLLLNCQMQFYWNQSETAWRWSKGTFFSCIGSKSKREKSKEC